MLAAEQYCVVQAGGAAVGPVLDVVPLGPAGWPRTAGECAPAISKDERSAQRAGEQALASAEVEWVAVGVEQDVAHLCVAGQAADRGCGEGLASVKQSGADLTRQRLGADRDDDVRLHGAGCG
jgi:hypothetical protein